MIIAINRANLSNAYRFETVLPKVAILLATISVIALGILALNVVTLASAPLLVTGVTAGIASLAALIGYIAAKNFVEKGIKFLREHHPIIDINNLPKWDPDVEFEDQVDFEPITYSAHFLVEDFDTYKLESIELLKKQQGSGLTRLPKKEDVNMNAAVHFPNLALVHRYKVCPLTQKPFIHPYICQEDHHTYERDEFINHWKIFGTSPVTGANIAIVHLYPNSVLYNYQDKGAEQIPAKEEIKMGRDRPVVLR